MSSHIRTLEPSAASTEALCLAFVNTVHDFEARSLDDDLRSYADLLEWAHSHDVVDAGARRKLAAEARLDPRAADAALEDARDLRAAMYAVLSARARGAAAPAKDLERDNAAIRSAMAGSELTQVRGTMAWRWAAGNGVGDTLFWPIARAAAHLLTSHRAERIVGCGGKTCTWLFLDTTKNHSRKFCSTAGCGNRTRVRRFYERTRKARR